MGTQKSGELDVVLVAGGVFSGTSHFLLISVVKKKMHLFHR